MLNHSMKLSLFCSVAVPHIVLNISVSTCHWQSGQIYAFVDLVLLNTFGVLSSVLGILYRDI